MKTTLKYFWKTLLMLFIYQEIIFLLSNMFKFWWLHLLAIVCLFILFLIIHKFKDKMIYEYLNDKDRPHICSRDMTGVCIICGNDDNNTDKVYQEIVNKLENGETVSTSDKVLVDVINNKIKKSKNRNK